MLFTDPQLIKQNPNDYKYGFVKHFPACSRKSQVKNPNVQPTVTKCRSKWKTIPCLCLISCFLPWKPMRLIEITVKVEFFMFFFPLRKEIILILFHNILVREEILFPSGTTTSIKETWACTHVYFAFSHVGFSALNTSGVTFCCWHLGVLGALLVSALNLKSAVTDGEGSASAGGFGPRRHPLGIWTRWKDIIE